jgi:hypothetical protein
MEKIPSLKIEGGVGHFAEWMTKQLAFRKETWGEFGNRKYKVGYSKEAHSDRKEAWVIFPCIVIDGWEYFDGSGSATILAVEDSLGKTSIEFIDGLYYCHNLKPGDPNSKEIIEYDYRTPLGENFKKLAQEIKDVYKEEFGIIKNETINEPETRVLNDWFKYYHDCKKTRVRVTLEEIAQKIGYNANYVRQKHKEYLNENKDITKPNKT